MRDPSIKLARKRVAILAAVLAVWVLAIVGRLVQLQLLESEDYAEYAADQQTHNVKLLAARGAILDRNGNTLALSLEHESIAINPKRVPDAAVAARALAKVFGLDRVKLESKIRRYQEKRWGFLWIRRWSTPEEAKAAHDLNAGWIEFYKEHKRYYPKGELASHVLGSVGVEESGLFGIEYKLEKVLSGQHGEANVLHDVRQRGIESRVTIPARPGSSIRITIDQRIQYAAETALKKAIRESGVPTGSVVVMDPRNGDILAMANYPDFNPNVRPRRTADLERRINRSMSLIYEPGSVFKVITLAAALEKTRIRPTTMIDCGNGSIRLPGRTIRDHHSYSSLTMEGVLAKSSNVGAINIASAVGKDAMYDYVRAFGFGERTGVELPFEEPGYVWPMQKIDKPRIYSNILASVAMGHQISTTTLQLAQACSVIANGGMMVHPRILLETRSPDGKVKEEPVRKGERVVKPETAITMRKMMESVVLEGTGKAARLAGWTTGGKTGTAQIFDLDLKRYLHEYHSSFMGFAPLRNPAIVIVVTLDRSKQYGGTIAAPVFQEVAMESLRILGIPMDNPATALARVQKPDLKDVEEGDPTLEKEALPFETAKLLPDTRRQILGLLAGAIKTDPEIEDWMLAADRVNTSGGSSNDASGAWTGQGGTVLVEGAPSDIASAERQFQQDARDLAASVKGVPAMGVGAPDPTRPVRVYVKLRKVPKFIGKPIRDVMAEALESGMEVQIYGRGIARTQIPLPGNEIPEGQPVRVLFAP